MMSHRRTVVRTSIAFAILGPPIGAVLFLGWVVLLRAKPEELNEDLLFAFGGAVSPLTYFFGLIPATATGAVIGTVVARGKIKDNRVHRFVVGAAVGGVCAGLWQLMAQGLAALADPYVLLITAAAAGGILSLFFPRRAWVGAPSNNRWRGP
jgi:hypothetical protein